MWWPNIRNFDPSILTDVVKRKLCEYILKRIGCDFLKEKTINMDQLTVEMYNGRASLSNLELDVVNINEILTKNGLPIEVVECYVGCISVSIPWRSIFSESSIVEVENVEVTIRHAGRVESEHNLIDSMLFTSMSTSMKLAEECLKKDTASGNKSNQNNPFEGVQDLACTVETIFSKVKANMKNTTIYYEHTDEERNIMVTLELRIDRIEYKDESGNGERSDASSNENYNSSNEPRSGTGSSGKGNNKSGNGFHSTPAEEKDDISKKRNMSSKSDGNSSTKTKSGHMTLIRIKNFILTGIRLYYYETPIVKQLERSTHEDCSKHKNDYSSSLIMMMAGTQEFKVQFIQDSSKFGPEIQVESRLGNLHLVLCPGILSTITNILDKINETPKRQKRSGPQSMKIVAEEYEKISKGWEKPIVRNVGGLGKQTFEQSDEEEFKSLCFTSFTSKSKWNNTDDDDSSEYLSNSGFFSMKNSCASSASGSSVFNQHSASRRNDQQQTGNEVFASTSINAELNLLSVVILHENPGHAQRQATTKTHRTSTFDIDCLHSFSDGYFHAVSGLSLKNMNDVVDIMKVRQEFSKIVAQDHLCLLCSVGEFKTSRQNIEKSFTISVSFGAFDFVEAIFGRPDIIDEAPGRANEVFNLNFFNLPDYTELLVFERSSKTPMTRVPERGISKVDPVVSIKMEVVHRKKYHSVSKVKQSSIMMTVKLSECHSEVDVTILDRLRSLTTSLSASNKQTPHKNSNVSMDQSVSGMLLSCDDLSFMQGNQASIDVAASLWSLKLRFPKLDLTFCDKNKRKAMRSERRLHEEYLLIDLVEPKLKAASSSEQIFVDLVTMTGTASLVQNNTKHTLLKISSDSTLEEQREGFNLPRFEVRRTNFAANSTLLVEGDNKVLDSRLLGSMGPSYYCGVQDVDQAPFSSVRHYFDTEELVYSGDRKDMLYFKDVVSDKTKLLVDINVPLVQIFINSKNTLELLYNRFLSDLALWQPEPESPTSSPVVLHDNNWATYSLINPYNTTYDFSGDQFNNTDSSSESEGERNEGFKRPTKINDETILCLSVAFKKAQLVAYCADARPASPAAPSTTSSTQTSNSKQVGKVYIDLDDTHIVFVYGYHGDPEIQYLCLQVCNAQLYHNGLLPVKSNKLSTFEDEFSPTNISHNLHKILYPSNNGIKDKGSNDMLSATIKMTYETFQQVMHYKVAVTVRCCTVKHHEGTVENYWANQLADLFTLVDYDIPGYELPKSSTELNFQLLDCSLDYQPTNLPYHAILYCQMFAICSSIIVETKGSVTKFIVEDTCLFLSKRINEEVINLEKNYVCVLDLASLAINFGYKPQNVESKEPYLEVSSKVGVLNIRTCSDSMVALLEFIIHVANVVENNQKLSSTPSLSSSSSSVSLTSSTSTNLNEDAPVLGVPRHLAGITSDVDQQERISFLIEEAMRENVEENESEMASSEIYSASLSTSMTSSLTSDVTPLRQRPQRLPYDEKPAASVFYNTTPSSLSASRDADLSDNDDDVEDVDGGVRERRQRRFNEGTNHTDDFCLVEKPAYLVPPSRNGEPIVTWHAEKPLNIIENYFAIKTVRRNVMDPSPKHPPPIEIYQIEGSAVNWHMFGGSDFKHKAHHKHGLLRDSKLRSFRFCCGPGRNNDMHMSLTLKKIIFQHKRFPTDEKFSTRDVLEILDIEIYDKVKVSSMNKFLHWYSSDKLPKKTFGRMLTVVCVGEKHEVDDVESEYSLKISLQPLKLNIDQDSLMFLYTFFNEISTTASRNPPPTFSAAPSQHATPTRTVRIATPSLQRQQSADLLKFDDDNDDEKLVSNMADLLQQQHVDDSEELLADSKQTSRPIFFKSLQFAPSVLIKIDYRGKRIENNSFVSIVAGLTQLSCSQITLKPLHYRHGLLGVEKLVLYMLNEWMVDVKRNQLTDFLSGVGPMNSLIQLVKGFIDLFWLPLEQYRKDGRILKGLRRGTHSFATCTALSALELTNKMLQAIQLVAEAAHDIVSTGPSIQSKNKLVSKRSGRPIDARDGVTKACALLRQGLANRCTEFCNEVIKEHEQKGVPGVIGEVARQIPPTVIAPVVLAAEASGTVLTGIRNQLVPVRKKEDEDKWKVDSKNKLSFQE